MMHNKTTPQNKDGLFESQDLLIFLHGTNVLVWHVAYTSMLEFKSAVWNQSTAILADLNPTTPGEIADLVVQAGTTVGDRQQT
eukprot:1139250-Pelagomonas_calceolata.AAC.1